MANAVNVVMAYAVLALCSYSIKIGTNTHDHACMHMLQCPYMVMAHIDIVMAYMLHAASPIYECCGSTNKGCDAYRK